MQSIYQFNLETLYVSRKCRIFLNILHKQSVKRYELKNINVTYGYKKLRVHYTFCSPMATDYKKQFNL